jgi:hypothetical protein
MKRTSFQEGKKERKKERSPESFLCTRRGRGGHKQPPGARHVKGNSGDDPNLYCKTFFLLSGKKNFSSKKKKKF